MVNSAFLLSALNQLLREVCSLKNWIDEKLRMLKNNPPLKEVLELLERIMEQNIEPDPEGSGSKIKKGVAKDRIISVVDEAMRHGRNQNQKRLMDISVILQKILIQI